MATLARKLRTIDYFSLGFGTMVGVGWLVLMDDWLQRGGPLGAILGFAVGGLALLPIGYIYGRLVMAMPDAASEIAYTAKVFPAEVSFATGWMMMLAYLIVCPWEAVAIGRLASYIVPAMQSWPLYRVGGSTIYAPNLALGLALTAIIMVINYRGIRVSATFLKWTTFGLLALFVVFAAAGVTHGSPENLAQPFSHAGPISVLLMLQVVPYYMTGFESVPKCAEEAKPQFRKRGYFRAIVAALLVGVAFYTAVIAVVAWLYPWRALTHERFATAVAFERSVGQRWIIDVILAAAILSLLKIFNGNFLAATRLLFALGRRGLVDARTSQIHPRFQTPAIAVVALGVVTAVAVLLGDAILVPISEVGALASAVGWFATCAAYFRIERSTPQRSVAVLGSVVAAAIISIKLLPFVPGHFTAWEWIALFAWLLAGVSLRRRGVAQTQVAAEQA